MDDPSHSRERIWTRLARANKTVLAIGKEVIGRAKGGIARAEKLSAVAKSDIGKAGAAARWGKLPNATHVGSFQQEFGINVECYVLNDIEKTTVISQIGMARVLGLSPRGNSFPSLINSQAMKSFVGGELREKVENPLKFQWSAAGGGMPPNTLHGFDTALLIDVCNAIIAAESKGALKAERYRNIILQAHIVVGASAKNGIRHLVYSLAGYNPTAQEVIAAFKLYIQEEAKKYEPEFPSELYMEWHRLYNIPVPVRGKPWHFKHLTVNHIYHPLAKSSGKILTFLRAEKLSGGDRQKKLFQFLNDVGARALRVHLGRVLEMAESSASKDEYEQKITRRFGDQKELELLLPTSSTALPPPS